MNLSLFHSWGKDISRLLFLAGVSAEVAAGVSSAETEVALPELPYDPNKTTEDSQWKVIDEKYGQNAYQALISAYADKILPVSEGDYRSSLLKGSTDRYMLAYENIKRAFMTDRRDLDKKFETAKEDVQKTTRTQLDILKSAVEGSRSLVNFKESMPGRENKEAVEDYFFKYLDALNGRYFNAEVNEGIKLPVSNVPLFGILIEGRDIFRGWGYEIEAKKVRENFRDWVEDHLSWMLEKKETTAADLESFKLEIAARYESYAKLDGSSDIISGADLAIMEKASSPSSRDIRRVLEENNDTTAKRLELLQIMNPDAWEDLIEDAGESIIRAAINGGLENEFVAQMQKYKNVKDFKESTDDFRKLLEKTSKAGAKETIDFIQAFNTGVHGEVLQYQMTVRPAALTPLVKNQLEYLRTGVLTPQKETDRMLVRFMNSDRNHRLGILSNPGSRDTLFRAIREATVSYNEKYEQLAARIPDDVTKIRTRRVIEEPTAHDQAAQLQALIILGNEAKVIVSKLEGEKAVTEINSVTPPPASVVTTGLRFHAAQQGPAQFRSNLEIGGFNGQDLALKGAKVLGALTVLSNTFQSWSETHGDFVERVFQTVEKAVSNQGVLAGAAITVGAHMAERDPRFLRYPWLSQHERSSVVTAYKLDNIGAKVGYDEMNRFLNNNAEWRALADPSMDPAAIKEMLGEAAKRTPSGAHPILAVSDLRKVIKDEGILTTLTTGGHSSRMRYLFYEKFFAATEKPDVNHMKEICTGTGYISPSPVKKS